MNEPTFINRDGMTAGQKYIVWLSDVKQRFHNAQAKTMVRVNTSMLGFYWSISRDIVTMGAEQKWGTGVVKQFELDIRTTFPNEKSSSCSNVKDMKRWYLFYFDEIVKSQQPHGFLQMPQKFGYVPLLTLVNLCGGSIPTSRSR